MAQSSRSIKSGKYPQEDPLRFVTGAGQSLADSKRLYVDATDRVHVVAGGKHLTVSAQLQQVHAWQVESAADFPNARQVLVVGSRTLLATDDGVWAFEDGKQTSLGLNGHHVVGISVAKDGRIAAATHDGAFEYANGSWHHLVVEDGLGRNWAVKDIRAVVYDAEAQLWIGQLAGLACRTKQGWKFYEGRDGLPYNDFTCAAAGEDGRVWFGTRIGLVGFAGGKFFYREGPRFMPGNEVRSLAVTKDGTPWLATDGGVAALTSRSLTLAEKAEHYEQQIDRYIKRTPLGYTSEVSLPKPGDYSEIIYHDSDNDGLWTAMYGASQCFAVAVTDSQKHRAAAKQAFEAIRFLQKVTQGGSHSPPRGYIARTILPTSGHNPNDGRHESDLAMKQRDRGWKIYEPRWPTSADGKWYWKSDTSSDELDGHYFFLPLYYDLVANTESEKERVREVVRDLTDHLLDHNYQLVDIDGQPTRWGVFNPENLNQNPHWWEGRGLNSLSILAYLVVAEHVTGDKKYAEAIEFLRKKQSYEANAMVAKVQFGPGSGNQSDDEMAMMSFYSLVKYAKDEQLRDSMRFSMFAYWSLVSSARNPFFNFAYAHHGLGNQHRTMFAELPLDPWDGWLEDSLGTLKGFPLDRLNWPQKNSHRLDLVALPRVRGGRPKTGSTIERGYCVDGKVLPIENRHFNHWNADAWRIDYAGDGRELASGTVFLLPYYMDAITALSMNNRSIDGSLAACIEEQGFLLIREALPRKVVASLLESCIVAFETETASVSARSASGHAVAARNVMERVPEVLDVWRQGVLAEVLTKVLGRQHGLVRVLFFDKPPDRTWVLPWHKDMSIAVQDNSLSSTHFTRPTLKAGVPHVIASDQVLGQMLTLRLHLDEVTEENGPLRVIPGSHVSSLSNGLGPEAAITITAQPGDVLAMRPLIDHCSGPSKPGTLRHRRILHLEFAAMETLPDGYRWHQFFN